MIETLSLQRHLHPDQNLDLLQRLFVAQVHLQGRTLLVLDSKCFLNMHMESKSSYFCRLSRNSWTTDALSSSPAGTISGC